jgi:hypothetical protein
MLTIAGDYLGQLQLKLNMLSMGHLSPSVIDPNNLRVLLSDIKSKLPPHLRLPKDEKKRHLAILSISDLQYSSRKRQNSSYPKCTSHGLNWEI